MHAMSDSFVVEFMEESVCSQNEEVLTFYPSLFAVLSASCVV